MRFQILLLFLATCFFSREATANWPLLVSHDWKDRDSYFQFHFRPRFTDDVGKLVVTNEDEVAAGRYEVVSKNRIRFVCLTRWKADGDYGWELQSGNNMGQSVVFEFDRGLDDSYALAVVKQSMCDRMGFDKQSPDDPLYYSKPIFENGTILQLSRHRADEIETSFPGIVSRDVWLNNSRSFKNRQSLIAETDLVGEWLSEFSSGSSFNLLRLVASDESKYRGDAWFIHNKSSVDFPFRAFRGTFRLIDLKRLESHDQLKLRLVATRVYNGEEMGDDKIRWTLSKDRAAIDFVIPLGDSTIRKSILASIETLHHVNPDGSIKVLRAGLAQLYKPLPVHRLGNLEQNLSLMLKKRIDGYNKHDKFDLLALSKTPPPGFRLLHPAHEEWNASSWYNPPVVKATPSSPPASNRSPSARSTAKVTRTAKVSQPMATTAKTQQPPAGGTITGPPKPRLVTKAEVQQILFRHEAKLAKQGYYDRQGAFLMPTVDAAMFYGRVQSGIDNVDTPGLIEIIAYDFATNHRAELRSSQDAIVLAIYGCQLVKYQHASALDTLAAAYANAGEFDLAVSYAEWGQQYYKYLPEGIEPTGLIENLNAYRNKAVPRSSHLNYQ